VQTLLAFPPLGDSVLDVCFDPAGDQFAACCRDGAVTVWIVPDGAQCLSARAPGRAHAVRFSPSGRTLAVEYDHGVTAFDSATGIVAAITERD